MKRTKITALFGLIGSLSLLDGCAAHAAPAAQPPPSSGATFATRAPVLMDLDENGLTGAAFGPDGAKRKRGSPVLWELPSVWAIPSAWPLPWLASPIPGRPAPAPAPGAPAAVAFAKSRLGTPYCWGGTGPGCYDCSGLTSSSWKAGGKAIPRTSEAQSEKLPEVPFDKIQPGDILWRPGHVALYVGDGQVIHAPRTGDVVRYAPATRFVKAVRP